MPDGFVSLAFVLGGVPVPEAVVPLEVARPGAVRADRDADTPRAPEFAAPSAVVDPGGTPLGIPRIDEVVRELTLLRLAACEAYARVRVRLLEGLARDVLGRELALAPCDLEGLARAALARVSDCEPLAIRVACGSAWRFALDIPVIEDPALAPGDLVVDVRDGTIDARFSLRLGALLAALA